MALQLGGLFKKIPQVRRIADEMLLVKQSGKNGKEGQVRVLAFCLPKGMQGINWAGMPGQQQFGNI